MFKHFLISAYRNLIKQKLYAFINISGLSLGIACVLIISIWVQHELSYDRLHENANQIYRVVAEGNDTRYAISHAPFGKQLKNDCADVIAATRVLLDNYSCLIEHNNVVLEQDVREVTPDFFDVFSFPLVMGDAKTSLIDPNSVVISEDVAQKFFSESNPIGKTLIVDNDNCIVTAVMKNIPHHSHLQFDILRSDPWSDNWGDWSYFTYILTHENISVQQLEQTMNTIFQTHKPGTETTYFLQPLKKIHLHSNFQFDVKNNRDIQTVYMLSIIAILVLTIACINFVNLTTARSSKRAKEAGIRKVIGSDYRSLVFQFLGEHFLSICLAFTVAVIITELILPMFNTFFGYPVEFTLFESKMIITGILILISTTILAGFVPSLFMAKLPTHSGFNFKAYLNLKGKRFRKILVTMQFACSVGLIIATFIISNQLKFMRNADMGFDKENLIYLPLYGSSRSTDNVNTLKNELLKHESILHASAIQSLPSQLTSGTTSASWEGKNDNSQIQMSVLAVDHDFLQTFQATMVDGRFYSQDHPGDQAGSIVINEACVKAMEMQSPLHKQFVYDGNRQIIGIIHDFHMKSLREEIEPLIIHLAKEDNPWERNFLTLRIQSNANDIMGITRFVKDVWESVNPTQPFEMHFLDDLIDRIYQTEQQLSVLFRAFTVLAIVIACLGLFGLASFMAEQRTKEIGVRKVLGASITSLIGLLSQEYIIWVFIANLVAWPVTYFTMNKWLQRFAYHVSLNWWIFVLSGLLALVIALLTVSYQAVRAATANPIESLRYE